MAMPSSMSNRRPTSSTRPPAGRSAWRWSTWAVATCTTPWALTRDAPASDIAARADAERQRWMKKAQVTAEKTAWLEVVAHAQSHLGSPRARARYDRTLALEAEEAFDNLAAFTLKGLGRLDPGTREALITEAAAQGIVPDRADRLIGRACRRLGVAREGGPMNSLAPMTMAQPAGSGASLIPSPSIGNGAARYTLLRCRSCGGRDRDQPRGPQGRLGALPALRVLVAMGLPRLPTHALGRRAAMPVRVPHGDARAGPAALRGGPAGVPRLRLRSSPWSISSASSSWLPISRRSAERPGPGPAAPGRAGPAQAGLSGGAGRRPAGRRPDGGRGLEPPGRSAVARDPGRLGRADSPAPPRRGAGRPRTRARTDRSPGGPRSLPAEPWRSPPTCPRPWPAWSARRPTRPPPWTPRCWATASACSGRPRPPTAAGRSRSSSSASATACSSIPATARGSPRSPRPSSTTCTSRRATRSATPS